MNIIQNLLTVNDYSRPGKKLKEVRAIVMHWTANPYDSALDTRNFFENKKTGCGGYASTHYIIDQRGYIVAAVPENEVAYHCGTSMIDPASGKVYTDEARSRFDFYASETNSPNNCTLSIELCPTDSEGNFSAATITAAVELCADICKRYNITARDITTHYNVVGWKSCPLLWTKKPELLDAFRLSVSDKLARG